MLGPWKIYTPENPLGHNIMYLESEGIDWYAYRDSTLAKYLLLLDANGAVVRADGEDKSHMFPIERFTEEVDEIPEDWEPYKYRFIDGKFVLRELNHAELFERNRYIQGAKVRYVSEEINTLNALVLSEANTPETDARLETLKAYVREVMKVNLSNPVWPEEVA